MHVDEAVQTWHIEVQIPTAADISVLLNQSMRLPGLEFGSHHVTIAGGAVLVLRAMTNICRQGECASCESWNSWCYTGWYIFKSVPEEVVVKCVLHVGFRVSIVLAVTAAATS